MRESGDNSSFYVPDVVCSCCGIGSGVDVEQDKEELGKFSGEVEGMERHNQELNFWGAVSP